MGDPRAWRPVPAGVGQCRPVVPCLFEGLRDSRSGPAGSAAPGVRAVLKAAGGGDIIRVGGQKGGSVPVADGAEAESLRGHSRAEKSAPQ